MTVVCGWAPVSTKTTCGWAPGSTKSIHGWHWTPTKTPGIKRDYFPGGHVMQGMGWTAASCLQCVRLVPGWLLRYTHSVSAWADSWCGSHSSYRPNSTPTPSCCPSPGLYKQNLCIPPTLPLTHPRIHHNYYLNTS
jgi:hypothetical protein